ERATRARARLVEATDVVARRARWREAVLALAAIDEQNDGHVQALQVVAAARRAAPLGGLIESFDAARARADEAAASVASAARVVEGRLLHSLLSHGRVQPGPVDPDQLAWDDEVVGDLETMEHTAELDPEVLRAVVASHRAALGALEGAPTRLAELTALNERIGSLRSQGARAATAAATARATAEAAAAVAVTARRAQQAAAVAAADLPAARQARTLAGQVLDLVAELAECETRLMQAQALRVAAVGAEQAARDQLLSVRELRLDSYAGELAQALVSGEACPVCGSCEHPAPALRGARHVGRAEEAAAATAAQTAAAARTEAEEACARLLARRHELLGGTGGRDLAAAGADVAAATERVGLAELAELECRRQTTLVAEADDVRLAAEAQAQECGADHARCAAAIAELDQQRQALADDLDRLRGEDADVLARSRRLTAEVAGAETLLQALSAAESAEVVLHEHRTRLVKALQDNGFARIDDARAALLPPDHLDQLAAVVAERERQRGDLLAVLAAPDLVGVGALDEPDLPAVSADVVAADQSVQREASGAALARQGRRRLAGLLTEVTQAQDGSAPLREQAQRVDELAACVAGTGGGNGLRMRLSAYVLAARLEEVAAAATERLGLMSDGRYALVHSAERGKGGGRSGLGLRVVDAWTGSERDTATLSGGESFLASLALALGLADVVQAEAGGGPIETLFVDEGFGSLDEETLEEVMAVLDGLRGGGRAVGLVSHVGDLKARIPAQLEVVKTRTGSTLKLHAST
ncbi:MAG TPA: SbcC/MukB-like Walker B domain-containing protein, partial [Actinomycetales bacterium]